MYQFRRNTAVVVYILCVSGGVGVTGLLVGDMTVYATKNGAVAAAITPDSVVEVDATNMPGLYAMTLPATALDTDGAFVAQVASVSFDTYGILGQVGVVDWMLDMRGLLQAGLRVTGGTFDAFGNMLTATIEAFDPGADVSLDTPRVTLNVTSTYDTAGRLDVMQVEEV